MTAAATLWPVHKDLLNTKVTLQLNLPMSDPRSGAINFPQIACKILQDLGDSLLIEHAPKAGQPVRTEQLPKHVIFSVSKETSVLA